MRRRQKEDRASKAAEKDVTSRAFSPSAPLMKADSSEM